MKIAMVINKDIPVGLIANTSAVLGISLSRLFPGIVGEDVLDGDGNAHAGITTQNIPVLAADREKIKGLRDCLFDAAYEDVSVIDFSEAAQKCLDYGDYIARLGGLPADDLYYLGICLYGPKKKVNKLTGNLGLLR